MTNEEKAREIYKDNLYDCEIRGVAQDKQEILFMIEKMATWKEQQMIEKAIGWIDYNNRNGGCNFNEWEKDFKKAMMEE